MAEFFVLIRTFQHPFEERKATVFVKEGSFFRSQGGDTEDWGKAWVAIDANSLEDARRKAHESVGTRDPFLGFKPDSFYAEMK